LKAVGGNNEELKLFNACFHVNTINDEGQYFEPSLADITDILFWFKVLYPILEHLIYNRIYSTSRVEKYIFSYLWNKFTSALKSLLYNETIQLVDEHFKLKFFVYIKPEQQITDPAYLVNDEEENDNGIPF
jgi:hypothetical protein